MERNLVLVDHIIRLGMLVPASRKFGVGKLPSRETPDWLKWARAFLVRDPEAMDIQGTTLLSAAYADAKETETSIRVFAAEGAYEALSGEIPTRTMLKALRYSTSLFK